MRKPNLTYKSFMFFFIIAVLSCTVNEQEETIEETVPLKKEYRLEICSDYAAATGTKCCISGALNAYPKDTLEYVYKNNLASPQINWQVIAGSISIISGKNSDTVKVVFGDDFDGGQIAAGGESTVPSTFWKCGTTFSIEHD